MVLRSGARRPFLTAAFALLASFTVPGPAAETGAAPAPHPVLADAAQRAGVDLSGPWHYSIDPYRDGLSGFHGGEAAAGHRRYDERDVEQAMRDDPNALYEYDMRQSPTVLLPSSWITHDPTLRYYDSLVWYQRRFAVRPPAGSRAFLRFDAVDYTAYVYFNGKFVGKHEGGFTPFTFEVTKLLRDGENDVTVGADAQRAAQSVPPPVTDWENYGGVTRPVHLVFTPATYVDDAWAHLTPDHRIAVSMDLDGPAAANRAVRFRIPALGYSIEGRTDADGRWSSGAPAPRGLKLWSPENPTLYDVGFETDGDRLPDRMGFRTVEVRGEDILLNGKPIFLRGISLHEEEFGKDPTRAITPAAARALLSEVKFGLHGNYVRLAHYPHSEVMTRMADELGLLVWSEIPVYWLVDFGNAGTLATARRMLAENILRDRDRASIVIWSVGNETPVSDTRTAFLSTLAADVRALDSSRLVSAALLTERHDTNGHVQMVIDDPLIPMLDVMAINTYNGWYTPDPLASLPDIVWTTQARKPLVFSEFGADALSGFHDPDRLRKFSEEFQAQYYRQTLAMADRIPMLRGMSPWILKDFRSPRRQHPVFQQGWNRKGLLSETGVRKQAFYVLADYYARKAQPAR